MTEVERLGELGLVRGERTGSGDIHLLHIVPHTFSAPDFHYHGSTKDFASRQQYFRDRGVWFDVFHHRKNVDSLATKLKGDDLPQYTHIMVDGSFTLKDWKYLKQRWPQARLIMRSHNLELPHRKDTLRALNLAAPTDDMERQAEDKRDTKRNRRTFLDRDLAAAKYADTILTIETLKPAARYWAWLGFRGEVIEEPYFLTDAYLKEIEVNVETKGRKRRDWVVCVMSSHPGPLTYHGLLCFHKAVKSLGERKPDWRFRATGRQFWVKNHEDYTPRVKPLGIVDDLMGLISISKAVAVLSELGRGFKTKILEAIVCRTWVLINPQLFRRLPDAVKPYCVVVDLDSPFGFDEAIDRIGRKEWPGGDPNGELREQAYAALDHVFFGDKRAKVVGATLAAGPTRKSTICYWSDAPREGPQVEATICTVLTPVHKRVAAHNYELVSLLNEGARTHWNVVDNHDIHLNDKRIKAFLRQLANTRGKVQPDLRDEYMQSAKSEYFDYGEITDYIPPANVIQGLSLTETFEYFYPQLESSAEEADEHRRLMMKFLASYHHASGLNLALEQVRTRYAVVLDPDLYVVRPNWLKEVIDHMAERDLTVFGAPWNPRWYQKYRYFPCTHLMVIDLQNLRWGKDMLAPDLVRPGGKYISTFWQGFPEVRQQGRWSARRHLAGNLKRAIQEDLKQRSTIGRSHDTGFNMLQEFTTRPGLKAECLVPVFKPGHGFQPPTVTPQQVAADRLLPDHMSYVPKKPGYFTDRGFDDFGYPDFRALGWEEFLWKGEPFAFHVRGELHRKPIGRTDDVQVLNKLNAILRKMGRPPLADRSIGGSDLQAVDASSWDHLDRLREPPLAETEAPASPAPVPAEASPAG